MINIVVITKKTNMRCMRSEAYPKLILVSSSIVTKDKFLEVVEVKLERPLLVTNRLKETTHH